MVRFICKGLLFKQYTIVCKQDLLTIECLELEAERYILKVIIL